MGFQQGNNILLNGKIYKKQNEQGYPINDFELNRVRRLKTAISNMKSTIKSYEARIITKKKFLNEIYDNLSKAVKEWESKQKKGKGLQKG